MASPLANPGYVSLKGVKTGGSRNGEMATAALDETARAAPLSGFDAASILCCSHPLSTLRLRDARTERAKDKGNRMVASRVICGLGLGRRRPYRDFIHNRQTPLFSLVYFLVRIDS